MAWFRARSGVKVHWAPDGWRTAFCGAWIEKQCVTVGDECGSCRRVLAAADRFNKRMEAKRTAFKERRAARTEGEGR